MLDLPPTFTGATGQIITVAQLLLAASSYHAETNAKTRARYSKFSQTNDKSSESWPSRLAMMVIYTPALIVSMLLLMLGVHGVDLHGSLFVPLPSLASAFCAVHFGKRCMEVLFLHKYSGRTDRSTPIQISMIYTVYSILIAYGAGTGSGNGTTTRVPIGTLLFVIGIAGNFYHHYLLANLRSTGVKYVPPRGGLFEYVAAPHYLFELIGWLGIAVVSHHLNAYLVFACMASYLSGRSVAQNDYNRRSFGEKSWPDQRRNLIPFVF
mmetsp:Transcript_24658/g.59462  ORF Transcript_24658/g.59462 Transcript_24658/m.59462 type:complete len:266 (-) Transcript_24658:11-808(-)